MIKKFTFLFSLFLLLVSFTVKSQSLNPGPWRFELQTNYARIPFIITLKRHKHHYSGLLHNGKETIRLNDIKLNKKTLTIPLQIYEMTLDMQVQNKTLMQGFLVRHNKNPNIKTPVLAAHGISERFLEKKKAPELDLTGRWKVNLEDQDGKDQPGIIIFEQDANKLYGSLLTPTGDYRYFEGYVSGKNFEVASFDGVYNYLIEGGVKKEKLEAEIRSSYLTKITGQRDYKAKLPDAYKQTQLEKPLSFSFPDIDGKMVSLSDPKYKDKPVIVQIYGSWCPNCLDEMNFLIPWYKTNKSRGIEVVALAFERSLDNKQAKIQLKKVQKKKNVPYPILLAGSTAEDKPMDKIPGLKNFISFPTTVFLNKKHEVVKIHAGFSGPGTGEFFEKWKLEFNETVEELLK